MLVESPATCSRSQSAEMNKLCRQVSIESPGSVIKDCVFKFEVPVPDVPASGARIRVVCAGACYQTRARTSSGSSASSNQSINDDTPSITYPGIRDGALFPGFEVSGVVDALGENVSPADGFVVGQRVVVYPHDEISHGCYAEYLVVSDLSYLVPVPDHMPLSVAAILPTGAVLAKNAVIAAQTHVIELLKDRPNEDVKILIVGTGGLALWAIRIASHHFKSSEHKDKVKVTVASLKDEGFKLAKELHDVNLVQWNEDLYEKQIIERTRDACSGCVDIVIDFGTTSRSLHRSLQCLNDRGVVLVNEEVADRLLPKFSRLAAERHQQIQAVPKGDVQQLRDLVGFVANGEILPPPHTEFSAEDACLCVQKLCNCEIPGRAILRFHDIQ